MNFQTNKNTPKNVFVKQSAGSASYSTHSKKLYVPHITYKNQKMNVCANDTEG